MLNKSAMGLSWDSRHFSDNAVAIQHIDFVGDATSTRTRDLLLRRQFPAHSVAHLEFTCISPQDSISMLQPLGLSWDRRGFETRPSNRFPDSILPHSQFTFSPVSTSRQGGQMARINIEDQFWLDVTDVVAKVGDRDRAIGMTVRWFRESQEKHKNGQVFSDEEFAARGFHESLIPLFANRTATGVMAVGAEKHFSWLLSKIQAGKKGGQKSAKRPRNAKGQLQKIGKNDPSKPKHSQAETKLHQPSPSIIGAEAPKPTAVVLPPSSVGYFVSGYCERFKTKYGTNPEITGKEAGIAKRVAKDWSLAKIDLYLDAYFQMPDAWLEKIKRPITAFETKLTEITVFAATGNFTTNKQTQQVDAMATNLALLKKAQGGK